MPDLPNIMESPAYFARLVMMAVDGAEKGSLRGCRCPLWEKQADPNADPKRSGSNVLPLSRGVRAFVETGWVLRSSYLAMFCSRLSAFFSVFLSSSFLFPSSSSQHLLGTEPFRTFSNLLCATNPLQLMPWCGFPLPPIHQTHFPFPRFIMPGELTFLPHRLSTVQLGEKITDDLIAALPPSATQREMEELGGEVPRLDRIQVIQECAMCSITSTSDFSLLLLFNMDVDPPFFPASRGGQALCLLVVPATRSRGLLLFPVRPTPLPRTMGMIVDSFDGLFHLSRSLHLACPSD
jgi:hypothetical protein